MVKAVVLWVNKTDMELQYTFERRRLLLELLVRMENVTVCFLGQPQFI